MTYSTLTNGEDGVRSATGSLPGVCLPEGDAGDLSRIIRQIRELADHDSVVRNRVQSLVRVAYGVPSRDGDAASHPPLLANTETIKALSLGVTVMTAVSDRGLADIDGHWHHAIAVALTAREIARRARVRDRDQAFVVGFLHDIGLLVPMLRPRVLDDPGSKRDGSYLDPRAAASHPFVGASLASQWGLTSGVIQSIREHHQERLSVDPGQATLLVRALQLADWLAASQGLAVPGDPAVAAGAPAARSGLGLEDDALEQLCLGLDRRVSQVCAALGLKIVSPDLVARSLFRVQLIATEPEEEGTRPEKPGPEEASVEEFVQRLSTALLEATGEEGRLSAFCLAVAQWTGVERIRCALSAGKEETLVVGCTANGAGPSRPSVRRMARESWQLVLEDQEAVDSVRHVFLTLRDGRRLDLVAKVGDAAKSGAAAENLGLGLSLLGLALGEQAPVAAVLPAAAEGMSRPGMPTGDLDPICCEMDALRTLGEMAGGAAHDVNNALAVVLGQAQLGQVSESVPEAQQYFTAIERASRDCAAIVRRLQEFARNARRPRGIGEVDLAALARETLEWTRPRWKDDAQKRGAAIRTALDLPIPVPIKADAGALRQVVTNLILNALDAMPSGGTLTLKAWSGEDRAYLSVADTGTGMNEETLSRIFEPFFTTKHQAGTGLGLAVARRIMQEHAGDIRVTSRPGLGSVFTISLPYVEVAEEVGPPEATVPARKALRVLLVDDEPQVRDVLMRMLRLDGHQAVAASTAAEGLGLLEQESFDLVMTDLGLPDMPGWQLARVAKAARRDVPVILVTGWTEEGDRPAPVEGVDAVLTKPFGMAELRRVVKAAVPD